jgi:flagellar basal-body rod modification protein FlgD
MANTIDAYSALNGSTAAPGGKSNAFEAGSAERFLKLLVTQMQNQDPLNPADNAQITSQMAQINTVSGIETLNTTVQGLNGRFVQMQALQGASLVGRDITVAGDKFAFTSESGIGGFELDGTADRVKVEVLAPNGRVVDTLELGAQSAGLHGFEWQPRNQPLPSASEGYRFRIVATTGAAAVPATPLMRDRVEAVSSAGDKLTLETAVSGRIDYSAVKAVGGS